MTQLEGWAASTCRTVDSVVHASGDSVRVISRDRDWGDSSGSTVDQREQVDVGELIVLGRKIDLLHGGDERLKREEAAGERQTGDLPIMADMANMACFVCRSEPESPFPNREGGGDGGDGWLQPKECGRCRGEWRSRGTSPGGWIYPPSSSLG